VVVSANEPGYTIMARSTIRQLPDMDSAEQ